MLSIFGKMNMDFAEYRKLSPEEKEEFLLNFLASVIGELQAVGKKLDVLYGHVEPLETQMGLPTHSRLEGGECRGGEMVD